MMNHKSHNPVTRREALRRVGNGFGMMAFASTLSTSMARAGIGVADTSGRGLATLDYPQRVKRVIFLFMNGGLSTIDSFDPKPMLEKYDGKPMPGGGIATERKTGELMKSPFAFKKYGQSGMEISELWPHLSGVADDICWVRSVFTEIPNHEPSCLMMNTGANQAGRPSVGAWLTYGLGTENQNLPGYVVLCPDTPTTVGPPLWSNGFLPAINQGTFISNKVANAGGGGMDGEMEDMPEEKPAAKDKDGKEILKKVVVEKNFDPKKILTYVNNPKFSLVEQRREMDLLQKLEKIRGDETDPQIEAVIKSMEIGYRMQTEAPDVFDIRKESQATLDMYGPRRRGSRRAYGGATGRKGRAHDPALLLEGRSLGCSRRYPGPQSQREEFRSGIRCRRKRSKAARHVERYAGGLRLRIWPDSRPRSWWHGQRCETRPRSQSIWVHHVAGWRRG